MKDVRGRVAAITGAGSGIGKACALRFAATGAKVALTDLDPGALEAVCAQVIAAGGEALRNVIVFE